MSEEENPNVLILVSDKARQYIKVEAAKSRMSMINFTDDLCKLHARYMRQAQPNPTPTGAARVVPVSEEE